MNFQLFYTVAPYLKKEFYAINSKKCFPLLFVGILIFSIHNSYAGSRYWVGGTGTWDASATTNWSASSGGASGASVPTSGDDVYFDASSGGGTVTIGASVDCQDFTWSQAGGTLAWSSTLNVYGSLTLNAAMTISGSSSLYFKATAAGKTINTNTKTIPGSTYFTGVGGGWTLQNAITFSSSGYVEVTAGTLTTNNNNITLSSLADLKVNGGTLTLGSSTVNFSSGSAYTLGVSSGTLNCNSATITNNGSSSGINHTGGTINFGSATITTRCYYNSSGTVDFGTANITITGGTSYVSTSEFTIAAATTVTTGTPTFTFTGANNSVASPIEIYLGTKTAYTMVFPSGKHFIKFFDGGTVTSNVTFYSNNVVQFESTKTFTFTGTITATGDCQNYIVMKSSYAASAATISTAGTSSMGYVQVKDLTKTGAGSIACDYCVNAGTNTTITFTNTYASRTLYWMGTAGTGSWGTGSNWTINSDGTTSGNTCVPTIVDDVIFDANSFDAAGKTVTVDNTMTFNTMNWTGITNSPTFTNSVGYPTFFTGNITLVSGIGTFTNAGDVFVNGAGNQLITCGGKTLSSAYTRFYQSGTAYQEDDAYLGTVYIASGTFDVQNQAGNTVNNTYIVGDWYHISGTFTPRTNATKYVIFNHASNDQYIQSAETFFNVQVNKSTTTSKVYTYGGDITIDGELKVTSGYYRVYVYTTTVTAALGSVNIATNGTIYGLTGTFTFSSNTTGNFNFPAGNIILDGMTLNIGVSGTHTTTCLLVGDAGSNSATLTVSGGTLNVVDQLWVKSDGIMDVQSGTVDIKKNSTNGGTAGLVKWQIDSGGEFKQSGGTVNVNGSADHNTTKAITFNTAATFTAANITGGTIVLKSNYSTYDYPVDFGGKTIYNLTVNQASRTFYQNTNAVLIKGAFTISAGTYDANGLAMSIAGNWVNTSGTFVHNNNTVTFNGTSTLTTGGNASTKKFYNVTLNGTSATLAGNIDIDNVFTITSGTWDVSGSNYSMLVGGNWSNSGTFTANSGTVTFDGGSGQTIGGSASTSFYNSTVNNSSTGVALGVNTTVQNTLTLTAGKYTTQGYTLTIGTTSTNGSIASANSTNYIVAYNNAGAIGYLKQFLNSNATYTYPIGDATNYTPLTFILNSNAGLSSADFTVHTKAVKVPNLNGSLVTYLTRYWLGTSSGITTPNYDISYVYNDADIVGTEANLRPVKKSGTTWYAPTGSNYTGTFTLQGTGSVTTGTNTLTWTGLSTFSYYGGSGPEAIGLPIELISFTGEKSGRNNELKWMTSTEHNNDYFTIEKTIDGLTFQQVGIVSGAGNSNQILHYSGLDTDVQNGINYYRLKQTDFDGGFRYSETISIDNRINAGKEISQISNILGQEVNEYYHGVVIIVYSDGTSIKIIQ